MCRQSSPAGLVLALLALVFQLAFSVAGGSMRVASNPVSAQLQALSALLPGADLLCHTDTAEGTGHPTSPSPYRHHGDCAICSVCFASSQPVAMFAVPPVIPLGAAVAVSLALSPPSAMALPVSVRTSIQPRAPPILT